jgi:hypothetical protein
VPEAIGSETTLGRGNCCAPNPTIGVIPLIEPAIEVLGHVFNQRAMGYKGVDRLAGRGTASSTSWTRRVAMNIQERRSLVRKWFIQR